MTQTGLLNDTRALLAAKAQTERQKRAALWAEYRAILLRQDKPHGDDAARLAALLDALGLDDRHAELHTLALAESARFGAQAAKLVDIDHEQNQCDTKLRELRRKEFELAREINRTVKRMGELDGARVSAKAAASTAASIELQYPGVLRATDSAVPTDWPTRMAGGGALFNKRRELFGNDAAGNPGGLDLPHAGASPPQPKAEPKANADPMTKLLTAAVDLGAGVLVTNAGSGRIKMAMPGDVLGTTAAAVREGEQVKVRLVHRHRDTGQPLAMIAAEPITRRTILYVADGGRVTAQASGHPLGQAITDVDAADELVSVDVRTSGIATFGARVFQR